MSEDLYNNAQEKLEQETRKAPMSKDRTQHTPEPWITEGGNILSKALFDPEQPKRGREVIANYVGGHNTHRIVACVNALEGIADPSVMPKVIAIFRRYQAAYGFREGEDLLIRLDGGE